jgi:hypothetical protein
MRPRVERDERLDTTRLERGVGRLHNLWGTVLHRLGFLRFRGAHVHLHRGQRHDLH